MNKDRKRRSIKSILGVVGFVGSILSILAFFSPEVRSQVTKITIGKDSKAPIITGNITAEKLIIQQPKEVSPNRAEDSNASLKKIDKFYLEADENSKLVASSIEKQVMDYGIIKTSPKNSGHNTIALRLRSKVNDRQFINGEYMTRVRTNIEIVNPNNNEVLLKNDVVSIGSSFDNYESSIKNASYMLKSRINNESIIYNIIDSVKEKHSLK